MGVQDVGTSWTKWQKIQTMRDLMLVLVGMLWKWHQPFQQELFYISSTGGTPTRKRNPLHRHSLNEQAERLQHDGGKRFEEKRKRVSGFQNNLDQQHNCKMVWQQSGKPHFFFPSHRTRWKCEIQNTHSGFQTSHCWNMQQVHGRCWPPWYAVDT